MPTDIPNLNTAFLKAVVVEPVVFQTCSVWLAWSLAVVPPSTGWPWGFGGIISSAHHPADAQPGVMLSSSPVPGPLLRWPRDYHLEHSGSFPLQSQVFWLPVVVQKQSHQQAQTGPPQSPFSTRSNIVTTALCFSDLGRAGGQGVRMVVPDSLSLFLFRDHIAPATSRGCYKITD